MNIYIITPIPRGVLIFVIIRIRIFDKRSFEAQYPRGL